MYTLETREKARFLRGVGKTYPEIQSTLGIKVQKSTLSSWCRGVGVTPGLARRLKKINQENLRKGRDVALSIKKERREALFDGFTKKHKGLLSSFRRNSEMKLVTLAILYLAEGSKTKRGSLMFGNSDPAIVALFVNLLRECYIIDESKFRATVQCRADQDVETLEAFWSRSTGISRKQFYGARVDERTRGKISRKPDYKGVCRIDYFSSMIDLELKYIGSMFANTKGL